VTYEELILSIIPVPHTITVQPNLGTGDDGEIYSIPVDVWPCYVDKTNSVMSLSGRGRVTKAESGSVQVLATATIVAPPDVDCPPKSIVTLSDGMRLTVFSVEVPDTAGLDIPTYAEIICK
jgi:hypothetical protein